MNKILLLTVFLTGAAFSQLISKIVNQVPPEVRKMIDGYIQNSPRGFSLKAAQNSLGVDPSLQLTDIKVGSPVEVYYIRYNALDTCKDDLPLKELLLPANIWTFPVEAHGKFIYDVEIAEGKDGKWFWGGAGELKPNNWWQKLRTSYPESSGISPILIRDNGRQFLYFPQKSSFNLFLIKYGNEQYPYAQASSNSMDSLDDSRRLVPHLIKNWKDTKPLRDAYNKKHPGTYSDSGAFRNKSNDGGEK
jgi:hypothetical protein